MSLPRGAAIVGALALAVALVQGGRDVVWGVENWSRMGPLPPGETLPAFAVPMLDGEVFDAQALVGKVTVVAFWATWCPACRDELGTLDELHAAEYAGRDDVRFVAVNREGVSPREARALASTYASERGLGLPVAIDDGKMARTFRVGPIPHTVVFDRAGTIRHVHQGRVTAGTIRGEVEELLGE
jgi:thiol-disulfide isomerase/thioredoxin